MKHFTFTAKATSSRLDSFLWQSFLEAHQNYSKSFVRKLICAGAVYLNRQRVRIASKPIQSGAKIEAYVREPTQQKIPENILNIVFEDEYLLAVDKPAGIPSVPTLDEARITVASEAKKYLLKRSGYCGIHHRLDKDTSGILLFTKIKSANKPISELFQERKIKKTYLALAASTQAHPLHQTIKNHLGPMRLNSKNKIFTEVSAGGDFAHTDFTFTLLAEQQSTFFHQITAIPYTGRTHQIRTHARTLGAPILGDTLYQGMRQWKNITIPRVMLHAQQLEFKHPFSKKHCILTAKPPEDFIRIENSFRKLNSSS